MTTSPSAQPAKLVNMTPGLIIFGIILIVFGIFFLLFVPIMGLTLMIEMPEQQALPVGYAIGGMVTYLMLAIASIWLGIGSIRCKRWARALLLVTSWIALICGFFGGLWLIVFREQMIAMMKESAAQSGGVMSDDMVSMIWMITVGVMLVIYLAIPAAFIFFYGLKNTRLTCESKNPDPSWTDRIPLQLLALVLLVGVFGVFLPIMICYGNSVPLFGIFLTGPAAAIVILLLSATFIFAAIQIYQQKELGWWLGIVGVLAWFGSFLVTVLQRGMEEFYGYMGQPEAQITIMKESGFLEPLPMAAMMAIWLVVYLAFGIYCRRWIGTQQQPAVS